MIVGTCRVCGEQVAEPMMPLHVEDHAQADELPEPPDVT
jgi:hypothetical protein